VDRDRQTRVGEILAATPLTRVRYTLAKTLSNFAILAVMTLVVAMSAGITQLVRAEDSHLAIGPLSAPFVFLALPALLVTAALAVLFETTPGLRGGAGNVAYFFLWGGLLAIGIGGPGSMVEPHHNLIGSGAVMPSIYEACRRAFPDTDPSNFAIGINVRSSGVWSLTTFRWEGIAWTAGAIAPRALWALLALAIGAFAALPFDRFDPARARRGAPGRGPRPADRAEPPGAGVAMPAAAAASAARLSPLGADSRGSLPARLLACVAAELKLSLGGLSRWWYAAWLLMAVVAVFLPLETARLRVLPLLWLWPILVWSPMGTREKRHGTDGVLFSSPHPLGLQFPAVWIAGALVAAASGLPIGARLALAGDAPGLLAWLVGAAFIPSLALALGVWTGSSRAFEALYTLAWYAGPLQPIPAIDFMGASRAAAEGGTPGGFAVATLALMALALAGRKRSLRN
jgi:hypothetical protein